MELESKREWRCHEGRSTGHNSQAKILNSGLPRLPSSQEGTKSCNCDTRAQAELPWEEKPCFHSAAPTQDSDRPYKFVLKHHILLKLGICSFGVSSPAIRIQGWPKCPLTIKPLCSNPGASAITKIMVPSSSSSSASSPEEWGKGREHREGKSANRMIMSFPLTDSNGKLQLDFSDQNAG